MAVLFSCIGNTDPIRNNSDGPMLHILRQYEDIDVCYLFLTKSMIMKDEDGYYDKPIKYLEEQTNRKIKVEKFKTDIEKVNDFDKFYDAFIEEIRKLRYKYPNEKIYVNVTSSTPQMIATLMLIISQGIFENIVPIQVDNSNPNNGNENNDYNVDEQIKNNKDNYCQINRAKEVEFLVMKRNLQLEQIKLAIKKYDYQSIIDIYKNEKSNKSYVLEGKLGCLIRHMDSRSKFDFDKAINQLKTQDFLLKEYMPYFKDKDKNALLEYFLLLKNLSKKPQLNDFVIRLPILAIELQKKVIKKCFKSYSFNQPIEPDFEDFLVSNNIYIADNVKFWNAVIKFYDSQQPLQVKIDDDIIRTFNTIEEVIENRNIAAHQIGVITKDDINNEKYSVKSIINGLERTIKFIYNDVNDNYLNIYDKINEEILSLLLLY